MPEKLPPQPDDQEQVQPVSSLPDMGPLFSQIYVGVGNAVPAMTQIEQPSDITALRDTTLNAMVPFGKVVRSRVAPNATRFLACVKQDHGSVPEIESMARDGTNGIRRFQSWLGHQNELIRIHDAVERATGKTAMHFIEIHADGRRIRPIPPKEIDMQNGIFVKGEIDPAVARNLLNSIAGQSDGALYLQSMMGMTRAMFSLCSKDHEGARRLAGLEYPERTAYLARRQEAARTRDRQTLQSMYAQDLTTIHELAQRQVETKLRPGCVGLKFLGAGHFHAGTDMQEQLRWDDVPRNIADLMLDDALERNTALGDLSFVVFEPNTFANRGWKTGA